MKNVIFIIASLTVIAITAGASAVIKTEKLETKIQAIEKDSEKIDNMILKKLDSIEFKLERINKCN